MDINELMKAAKESLDAAEINADEDNTALARTVYSGNECMFFLLITIVTQLREME